MRSAAIGLAEHRNDVSARCSRPKNGTFRKPFCGQVLRIIQLLPELGISQFTSGLKRTTGSQLPARRERTFKENITR
jgi:hypothetical protein